MSMMPPQEQGGPDLQQLLSQLGQGQQPERPENGDWLAAAINAVRDGMEEEDDAKIVSDLGDILNRLTTVQMNMHQAQQGQRGA